MRAALILALSLALSACAGLAEQAAYSVSGGVDESPEFGVSALADGSMPPNYAAFNRVDPSVADFHARQRCTLGYEKLGDRTVPYDPGQLEVWQLRCVPYALAVF
ncbi:MAG: hypothetical protein IRZ04_20005 [Rhodospirillales bacterium]|nr:hypothetical protein [Rhodospirillales bacterium]